MIGHADGGGENVRKLRRVRTRRDEIARLARPAGAQESEGGRGVVEHAPRDSDAADRGQ